MSEAARAEVAAAAARMVASGLVVGTAGNISVRCGEDLIAITPSGLGYDELSSADIGLHRLDGSAVDAPWAPSSELPLHLAVYATTTAAAVVHTHSPAATAVSLLVEEVPPIHYYAAMFGGPIRVAPYHPFGSPELAAAVAHVLADSSGALLAHHGAVTIGFEADAALELAEVLEWLCDVYLRAAAAGTPAVLGPAELEQAAAALASYRAARPHKK